MKTDKYIEAIAARKSIKLSRNIRKMAAKQKDKQAEEKYAKQRDKGLNMNQLIACCDQTRRDNAIRDSVKIVTLKRSGKEKIVSKSLTYDNTTGVLKVRPHKHVVEIMPSAGGEHINVTFSKAKRLLVGCDCEDWLYRFEYAMDKRWGASNGIQYGNAEYPEETNPSLNPGICKHLWVLLRFMKQKGY